MKNKKENYGEVYKRIKDSPELAMIVRKSRYESRARAVIVLMSLGPFMALAYLAEKLFHISGYLTCTIAGIAMIVLAVVVSRIVTNKKFGA